MNSLRFSKASWEPRFFVDTNGDFRRPILNHSQLLGYALLNFPNETSTVPELHNLIIDQFPYFESMDTYALKKSLGKALRQKPEWFKKHETPIGLTAKWSLVNRERFMKIFQNFITSRSSNVIEIGMKCPELFRRVMFMKQTRNDILLKINPAIYKIKTKQSSCKVATAKGKLMFGDPFNISKNTSVSRNLNPVSQRFVDVMKKQPQPAIHSPPTTEYLLDEDDRFWRITSD